MLVLSEKTPMGLVLLLSSRNLRSMRLVVRIFFHSVVILDSEEGQEFFFAFFEGSQRFGVEDPPTYGQSVSRRLEPV